MRWYLAAPLALIAAGSLLSSTQPLHAAPLVTCLSARWPVKTLSDGGVSTVGTAATTQTVAELVQIPSPSAEVRPPRHSDGTSAPNIVPLSLGDDSRVAPAEDTTYQVTANQVQAETTDDGTIWVEIADPNTGDTMLAEFPDTTDCAPAADPTLLSQMQAARDAFVAAEGTPPTDTWKQLSDQAQITGIGFFDPVAQAISGSAPNGLALGPILSYVQTGGGNSAPPATMPALTGPDGTMPGSGPQGVDGDGVLLSPTLQPPATDGVMIPATALGPDGQSLVPGPYVPGQSDTSASSGTPGAGGDITAGP